MLHLAQAVRTTGTMSSAVFWIILAVIAVAAVWWFTTAGNRNRIGAGGPGDQPERNRERDQGGGREGQDK